MDNNPRFLNSMEIRMERVNVPGPIMELAKTYLRQYNLCRAEEDWICLNKDWALNIWEQGGKKGGTAYPVTDGKTDTREGVVVL